jgi:hypothetical protein
MEPIFVIAIVVVIIASAVLRSNRSTSILDQWALENGFEVVSASQAQVFRGPFTLTASRDQTVYRITVRDQSGRTMTGWARCGSWMLGLASNNVEVVWD